MRLANRFRVRAHELFPSFAFLDHQARVREHGDVLLHGGEAHRVEAGEAGDVVLTDGNDVEDVAPRRVGEGVEHPVDLGVGEFSIYNHLVVDCHRLDRDARA